MTLWRDGSNRLTFDLPRIEANSYPAVCRAISDAFELKPVGEIIIGPEQMFWEFHRGDQLISLDWDIWMGFMVASQSAEAESLIEDIAAWLLRSEFS
jgi:hypothetical protein